MPLTFRLLNGEKLFIPGEELSGGLGLHSHIRRHGKWLHTQRTTRDGRAGLLVWADDQPGSSGARTPYPEAESVG